MIKKLVDPSSFIVIWILCIMSISYFYFEREVTLSPILYIVFCLFLAFIGGLFGYIVRIRATRESNLKQMNMVLLRGVFFITFIVWSVVLINNIISTLRFIDLSNPLQANRMMIELFVENEGQIFESEKAISSAKFLILYILGFPSLLIGSVLAARGKVYGFAPLILGGMASLVSFARFHMFVYFILFTYTYLQVSTNFYSNTRRLVRPIIILLSVSVMLFIGPAYLRMENDEFHFAKYLAVYMFGGIAAFCNWFNTADVSLLGDFSGRSTYTLFSWFSKLGLSSPPDPLHLEFTSIGDSSTNVYSLFRLFVEDFGVILTPWIFLLFGFLSSILTRMCVRRKSFAVLPVAAYFWAFAFFSFYSSIANDFRILLGCLFSTFLFSLIGVIKNRKVFEMDTNEEP